jgi:hypothetical protein
MIKFDENNKAQEFTIVLSNRNYKHYGQLNNVDNITYKGNLNSADEISFQIHKVTNENIEPLWDDIIDLKLIWVKEINKYFEIRVSLNDSTNDIIKSITATSLCEAELSQVNLYEIEINTEDDIDRDDYVVTKFYNPDNVEGSLLHRILDKVPHYTIKHVDESLMNLQRSFSIDGTSIYDFLTGECSEQFNCLFIFDSTDRSVSVYDLYTVCNDCGYRGEYNDICPECGSTNLKYYGDDTTIFIDKENLTDEVVFETDVDSIKNCFRLQAGDDDMTAAIVNCNPNGSSYVYYISDEQKKDMSQELVEKLNSYDELYNSYTEQYAEIMSNIYDCIDMILYYESEMMPDIEHADVTAETEAAKLTVSNLSPLGLSSVTTATSTATVNSALKNYAKVYVKTGYVKLEIDSGEFTYVGTDSDGNNYGTWYGRFKVTNYSDEEDIAYSDYLNIKVYDLYSEFLDQKIKKNISSDDDDDGSIYDVLEIEDLTKFKEALTLYCLNRLTSFYDAIQGAIDILIEADQAGTSADLYSTLYLPYYNKLQACQSEIDARQTTIDEYASKQDTLETQKKEIQKVLDFESYLGEELFLEFSAYRREDTYSNDNFISDGLNNDEIFENAQEFLDTAKKELFKSAERQHSITTTLHNLLLMDEFKPIVNNFEVGNWIRIAVEDNIYRLRLTSYEISFNNLQTINVEFSDMTKTANSMNDIKSILSNAQSMASSYSYISNQANKGDEAQGNIQSWIKNGLDSALVQIKNNDNEEITYGKHGLLARSYDDITDLYSDEQLKITHNILAFTDDNWKTVKTALGKHNYTHYNGSAFVTGIGYGLSSEFVQAGYVSGSQIIGGDIYSENYSSTTGTHIDLDNGNFSFAGGKLKYDGSTMSLDGKITAITGTIGCWTLNSSSIYKGSSSFGNASGMYFGTSGLSLGSAFKVTSAGAVTASNLTVTGGSISIGSNFKVDSSGNMTANSATITGNITTSNLTATGGKIANFTISGGFLYNGIGIGTAGSCGLSCGTSLGGSDDWMFWAGNGMFRVDANGNCCSNSFNSSNANITGGTININTDSDTSSIIKLNYNTKSISMSSGGFSLQDDTKLCYLRPTYLVFRENTSNYLDMNVNVYGLSLHKNTYSGSGTTSTTVFSVGETGMSHTGSCVIGGNFTCSGTKSRVATTEDYNQKLLYCYETPSPLFGDIGNAILDEYGECYIYIDDVFKETINTTDCKYNVFITRYGDGTAYVSERTSDYFVVIGTPGLEFSWEIKAKQKDYEVLRLENFVEIEEEKSEIDYENEAIEWVNSVESELLNYE